MTLTRRDLLLSGAFALGGLIGAEAQQGQRIFEPQVVNPRPTGYTIPQDQAELLKIPPEELKATAAIDHYTGEGLRSILFRRQQGPVGPSDLEIRLSGRPLEVRNAYRINHDFQVPRQLLEAEYAANEIASSLSDSGYINQTMEILPAHLPERNVAGIYAILARSDSQFTGRIDYITIGGTEYSVSLEAETESELVTTVHNGANIEAHRVKIGLIKSFVLKSVPTDQNPAEARIDYLGPGHLTLMLDDRLNSHVIDINIGAGFRTSYPEILAKLREVERIINPADFINTLYNSLKDKQFYFGKDMQFLKVE